MYYRPFTEKTGIEVVGVQASAEPVAQIRSMVDTKSYTWDMAKISQPRSCCSPRKASVPREAGARERSRSEDHSGALHVALRCGDQHLQHGARLSHRRVQGPKAPSSWGDFWNVKDFPGRRSLRKHPFDTLEESAMASGVPTSQLYPLNVDKAFANLDAIKPKVDVVVDLRAQVEQMLKTGEVDMIATWVSRPQSAIADGAPGRSWEPEPLGRGQLVDPGGHAERGRLPRVHQVRLRSEAHGRSWSSSSRRSHAPDAFKVHQGRHREELPDTPGQHQERRCRSTRSTGSTTRRR